MTVGVVMSYGDVMELALCCPSCSGRSFRLVQSPDGGSATWLCTGCGKLGKQDELVGSWPEGTLRVLDQKEEKP